MNGDRKGPEGKGPKTGRALGFCVGNDKPGRDFTGNANLEPGSPVEFGLRGGRGMRNGNRNGLGGGQGARNGMGMRNGRGRSQRGRA